MYGEINLLCVTKLDWSYLIFSHSLKRIIKRLWTHEIEAYWYWSR